MRSYGMTKPITGYYDSGRGDLFYYNETDHSLMLIATPGGGKRVVFKKGHNLYGPLYALLFVAGAPPYTSEAEGLAFAEVGDPTTVRTTGTPVPASPFAWLDSLEQTYSDRKPFVRLPAFWAVVGVGALGVGYFVYSRRAHQA